MDQDTETIRSEREGRRARILGEILFWLYGFFGSRTVRYFVRKLVKGLEGGETQSLTLRRIFSSYHRVHVGLYSYGGCFEPLQFDPDTTVGRYCSIAHTVHTFGANHPLNFRSTHPAFYNPSFGCVARDALERTHLKIGSDVWIGHNATILSRVRSIGDGAVVGAGSVVTRDVPPFAIVAGNPARVIAYRFSAETIREVQGSRWWERTWDEVRSDIESFQRPLEDPAASETDSDRLTAGVQRGDGL